MRSAGAGLGLTWLPGAAAIWGPALPPLQPFMTFNFAVEIEVQPMVTSWSMPNAGSVSRSRWSSSSMAACILACNEAGTASPVVRISAMRSPVAT